MTFDDFWKNETGPGHLAGLPSPKDLARAAWNRAAELEREECAEVCDERHHDWRFDDGDDSISGPREPRCKECGQLLPPNSEITGSTLLRSPG